MGDDTKYTAMAQARSNMESAIADFVKAAREFGDDSQAIADVVADCLYDGSGKEIKIEAVMES